MTAEPIARVVADLRAGRARNLLKLSRSPFHDERVGEHSDLYDVALSTARFDAKVIDATAIYRRLGEQEKAIWIYEDHPCIAPPFGRFDVCYRNEHGNVVAMCATAIDWNVGVDGDAERKAHTVDTIEGGRHMSQPPRWEPAQPVEWDRVRWTVDTFCWVGGRGAGGAFPTGGPAHLWRFAVYDDGAPADLHWVQLLPDYPREHWDMAHLVLLGAMSFLSCFAGETKIVTSEGILPIGKVAGRDIEVLSRDPHARSTAGFVPARVESFGVQPIVELEIARNGARQVIRTTDAHRWFVRRRFQGKNGGSYRVVEATTAELKAGDRLATVRPKSRAKGSKISGVGVAHGLIYGDGTRRPYPEGCCIDIYGDDRYEMLRFFPEAVVWEVPANVHRGGEDQARCIRVSHLPRSFKDLPPEDEASPYLVSFLAGWFAADGDVGKTGSVRLSSARPEPLEWVHRVALERLGIITDEPRCDMRRGIGGIIRPLWSIRFDRASLTPSFFVREHHLARYRSRAIKAEPNHWRVVDVRATDAMEEVYCAVVPGTESFVLDGMILTGNCRNVELVEPRRDRAERRRLARTGVTVHELAVFPIGRSTRRRAGEAEPVGVPLTSVRGHFASYGPKFGRGLLFGKYEGRYWIGPHARGEREHGEHDTSYVLADDR